MIARRVQLAHLVAGILADRITELGCCERGKRVNWRDWLHRPYALGLEIFRVPFGSPARAVGRSNVAIHRYGRVCQADFFADFVAGAAGEVFVVSGVFYGTG